MISPYPAVVEQHMCRFASFLSEKDRRRYAAVEVDKLGHGGMTYIADLLKLSPTTIRAGAEELEQQEDPAAGRVRKKGAADFLRSEPTPNWKSAFEK